MPATLQADDWPQWLGPRRDSVWRETGILDKFPPGGPKLLWRTPLGAGYTGPAVAGGKVFVMDRIPASGSKVNTSSFAPAGGPGTERVLCLDAQSGRILWKHEYECRYRIMYPLGPRCTPTVHEGKVYSLGAMGNLFCLDAETGKVIWEKDLPKTYNTQPPPAGYATHPLVDGRKLICHAGGAGSTVVALDKETGQEIWRALSAPEIGYCPPVLIDHPSGRQLIIWDPAQVSSLDPETGRVHWSQPFKSGMNMNISAPRLEGDLLFVTSFFDGSLLLRLERDKPVATVVWQGKGGAQQRKTGMRGMMCTPFFKDGYIYGICGNGELRCLKAETGDRLWDTLKATRPNDRPKQWANAFIIAQEDRFFLANEQGELLIARLTPQGYDILDRAKLLEPTHAVSGRDVVWSHPAFANRCVYARNDKEIVCYSLAKGK
jgi:outer membrane protein assembly factor BamB